MSLRYRGVRRGLVGQWDVEKKSKGMVVVWVQEVWWPHWREVPFRYMREQREVAMADRHGTAGSNFRACWIWSLPIYPSSPKFV